MRLNFILAERRLTSNLLPLEHARDFDTSADENVGHHIDPLSNQHFFGIGGDVRAANFNDQPCTALRRTRGIERAVSSTDHDNLRGCFPKVTFHHARRAIESIDAARLCAMLRKRRNVDPARLIERGT